MSTRNKPHHPAKSHRKNQKGHTAGATGGVKQGAGQQGGTRPAEKSAAHKDYTSKAAQPKAAQPKAVEPKAVPPKAKKQPAKEIDYREEARKLMEQSNVERKPSLKDRIKKMFGA